MSLLTGLSFTVPYFSSYKNGATGNPIMYSLLLVEKSDKPQKDTLPEPLAADPAQNARHKIEGAVVRPETRKREWLLKN